MPSVSSSQRRLFGMALAHKRGQLPNASPTVKRMAAQMSEQQLRDFAITKDSEMPAKQAAHPILDGVPEPEVSSNRDRRQLIDEAQQSHYQDQPFSTAALMGGAAGLVAPTALGLLLNHKDVLHNPMPYLHAGAVMSPLGAATGVGAEATGRLLTRGLGPSFDRRHWHRDQDPHRWNSALRTAPLVAALLAGRALPSLLQRMPELQGKQADVRDHKTRLRDAEAQVAVPTQGQIDGGGNSVDWKVASDLAYDFKKRSHGEIMLHEINHGSTHNDIVASVAQRGVQPIQAYNMRMAKHAASGTASLAPLMHAFRDKWSSGVVAQPFLSSPQFFQEGNVQVEKKAFDSTSVPCVVQQWQKGSNQGASVFGSPFSFLLQPAGAAEMHVSPFVHLKLAQRLGFATFAAGDAASFQCFGHPAFSSNASAVEADRVFGVGSQITQGFGGAKYAGSSVASFRGDLDEMNTSFPFECLNGIENPVAVAARHRLPFSLFKASSQSESLKRFTRAGSAHKPDGNPSKAQINAGNYKMQHLQIHGLEITLETASGQERKGVAADGTPWSITLSNPYGYIKNTDSAEPGDQMDVFIGPDPASEAVYVVDQNKPGTDRFDEAKVMLGWTNMADARKAYHANYSPGWKGFRNITAVTMPEFKFWLKHGDLTKPYKTPEAWLAKKAGVSGVAADEGTLSQSGKQGVQMVRSSWNQGVPALVQQFSGVLGRHVSTPRWSDLGTQECKRALLQGELHLGYSGGANTQPSQQYPYHASGANHDTGRMGKRARAGAWSLASAYDRLGVDRGEGTHHPIGGAAQEHSVSHLSWTDVAKGRHGSSAWYMSKAAKESHTAGLGCGTRDHNTSSELKKSAFDWAQLGQTVRQQMPGFHGWDTAAGAVLGGGAGYLGSAFSSDAQTRRNRWRNTLLGAVGGGAAANLVGDRARRYISNIPGAFGYETSSMLNPARRAGLKGIWEGAVLDKPIAPVKGEQGWDPDRPGEWLPQGLPRRELLRRALGVHAPTKDDYFVNVGSAVHDGKMHDKIELNRQFFDPTESGKLNPKGLELFRDVVDPSDWAHMHAVIAAKGKNFKADSSDLYDGVSIGSNIFGNLPLTTHGQAARARDVWDFGWSEYDANKFRDILHATLKDPKSLWTNTATAQDADKLLRTAGDKVVHNADVMKSLLARRVLNDVLLKRAPIFEQNFAGSYDPDDSESIPDLELFRSSALPLPNDANIGKGIGMGVGALGAGGLADWLLHRNDRKPKPKKRQSFYHPAYA